MTQRTRRRRAGAGLLVCAAIFAAAGRADAGEQRAVYRAAGAEAGLFDQYDNDGYSLAVVPAGDGGLDIRVRVVDAPLESRAPFAAAASKSRTLPAAPDRDAWARERTSGSATQSEAVRRILLALASEVKYDPDRLRNQDPAAVFSTRRAYCVGFAELAVDLLRRVGISARTVQGVLRTDPTADRYDPAIGGVYHRWIEVYYPDRGYVFSDPAASVNGVDARYVAFEGRSLTKPRSLRLTELMPPEGALEYATVRAGGALIRVRASR